MNSDASETWDLQRPHWCWGTHLLMFSFWPCPELPECTIQHLVPNSPSASQALWCHRLVLHHESQVLHVLWLPQHNAWSLSISSSPTSSISCSVPPVSLFALRWPCNKSTQGSWTAPGKALFPGSGCWNAWWKSIQENPQSHLLLQTLCFLLCLVFWKRKEEYLSGQQVTKVRASYVTTSWTHGTNGDSFETHCCFSHFSSHWVIFAQCTTFWSK